MKGFGEIDGSQYTPSRYALTETTHIFPTLTGGVDAVDWSGKMFSHVIEVLKWLKVTLSFLLAWDYDPRQGVFFELPLDIMEYNNVAISITNTGDAPIAGKF